MDSLNARAEIEEAGAEVRRLEQEVSTEERRTAEARTEGVLLRQQAEAIHAECTRITVLVAQQKERVAGGEASDPAVAAREVAEGRAEARRWEEQVRSLEDRIAEVRAEDARSLARVQSG